MLPDENAGDVRWWLNPAKVQGFVHGVFEGGGVKGILYVGALEGVLKRRLWFSAVAGSSAGAITAAMIAAGLRPEDMRREMEHGLNAMTLPTIWNGFRRLRNATGFLNQEAVRTWLRDVLQAQAVSLGAVAKNSGPSFEELFKLTGIDLYVVAVDLSARRVIVFNRTLTPDVDVADSVMASATIPAALEPLVFETNSPAKLAETEALNNATSNLTYRMIADGGIASNFPSFVFRDDGFRAFAKLDPIPATTRVVGFLLNEGEDASEDLREEYRCGQIAGTPHDIERKLKGDSRWAKVPKFRRRPARNRTKVKPVRILLRGLDWLLFVSELALLKPVLWLGKGFETPTLWNLPALTNRHVRMEVIQSLISTAPLPLLAGVAAFSWIFWVGFSSAAESVFSGLKTNAYRIKDFYDFLTFAFELLLSAMALVFAGWMFVLGLATLALLRLAYPTLGMLGHPLIKTFLQAPAAPPWAGHGRNETVVRLRVPPELKTLGAEPGMNLTKALQDAENSAYAALEPAHTRGPAEGRSKTIGATAEV
jgi:predicted acylesterase/phospholipase RssA